MNYYYEAITGYINSINSLPKSDKLSYINKSKFSKDSSLIFRMPEYEFGFEK
ncbi:hypothetical protein [Clostridium saccharoperbutylacetonicum]|uniref:hypothetical protein n=1 Tax=Clostridium saccharoperbutylacetonicum TaxID=36745 RepID=UPI00034DCE94|nr:hypothetical protein [Clostridium saccharoperbutylacetonicum]